MKDYWDVIMVWKTCVICKGTGMRDDPKQTLWEKSVYHKKVKCDCQNGEVWVEKRE
jgi:hypothetical protein